jgi:hypothetical protein
MSMVAVNRNDAKQGKFVHRLPLALNKGGALSGLDCLCHDFSLMMEEKILTNLCSFFSN